MNLRLLTPDLARVTPDDFIVNADPCRCRAFESMGMRRRPLTPPGAPGVPHFRPRFLVIVLVLDRLRRGSVLRLHFRPVFR
jgi:hypothetical protein